MFGLSNVRGSCWVNSALQSIFACPPVRERWASGLSSDAGDLERALYAVYTSKGTHGLSEVFTAIQTKYMPAGKNIGDSHELIVFLCDSLPWLDTCIRFRTADTITCTSCSSSTTKEDSVVELGLYSPSSNHPLHEVIAKSFVPQTIEDWTCEQCKKQGCTSQQLLASFPRILMIHAIGPAMDYSSVLVINGRKYALFSVLCYNGAHWWTYARHLPIGNAWYKLDDSRVQELASRQFPVTNAMRVLLYFLLEN
jgi:uncharacterized UBP type Zn finger protein